MSDVSKLPKWAQALIADQGREISTLRDSVSILEGVVAGSRGSLDLDTDVWLERGMDELPLPKGSRIQFGGAKFGVHVWLSPDGNLEVNSSRGAIAILPRAANAVVVRWADQ